MRIQTSLRLTSAIAILMLAGTVVGSVLSFRRMHRASAFEFLLIDLQGDIFESTQLRNEFLLMHRQQGFLRWQEKSTEIDRQLQQLAGMPLPAAGAALLARMNLRFQATLVLLPRIAALRSSPEGNEPGGLGIEPIEQRLTNQLLVDTYLLSDSTKLLLLDARTDTIHARNRLLVLLVLSTLAVALTVTTATVYLSYLMSWRVAALKAGTDTLSRGTLDYRIPVVGDDELADLAREVNDMAEKLQQSYGLLEATNKELEAFTYSVSHDLRAPLRHLTGFVALLDRMDTGGLEAKSRHYLEVISHSATKMGCLIDDLLSFSRMGRGEMMTRSVDLKPLAQEVIEEFSRDLPAGRTIDWHLGDLPVVRGDRPMLRLVLVNLLSNGIKYSRHKEVPWIEVGALAGEPGFHTLYVKDHGAGFDMRFVDKLFGLFQRLHASEAYEGTGVGLANVRRIIARHGGKTWAEGELNQGATFYFTLPQDKEC